MIWEISKVLEELEKWWELEPQMLADYGNITMPMVTPSYISYRRPSIKQKVIKPEIGVAAFVTEEQIDHRGSDPQYRYELFIITHKDGSRVIFEDHAYEKRRAMRLLILKKTRF